jgi:hypothetical protein
MPLQKRNATVAIGAGGYICEIHAGSLDARKARRDHLVRDRAVGVNRRRRRR